MPHLGQMRQITYAGENVITTDAIARLLVDLTAELAKRSQAEAVSIPIDPEGHAELVVGLGNDVLSVPIEWHGREPDFDTTNLTGRLNSLRPHRADPLDLPPAGSHQQPAPYDPDLDVTEA